MNSVKFNILFDPSAARDLKKLSKANRDISKHIISAIDSLISSPFKGKSLKGDKQGCYSLRYSNYRIIYEVYLQNRIIHIIRIGHRRNVYR